MISSPDKIEQIFWDALQLASEEERGAYLERVCGTDHELRQLVEKLLRAQPKAAAFLEQPLAETQATVDEPIPEGPGTVIGPYKLLEQIGEGGFGLVFMAEQQQPIRRKVALKVLKPGMDTRQVIARFEAERQALALMDHPNIAKVLEGGETASGRPYFVMDLVKGVPITEYGDQNTLTTRERLELFVSVCQAVQHAHQKGIIHRDIKPSNVLVTLHDGSPLVKVIDFGIAKALGQQLTDKTLFTGFAQMIGTPLYMSPEQAALSNVDVDTRSDIYSLGVVLYELLTGTTPFDKERLKEAGYDELRRIIREEEPPKPSTRISTLGQAASTVTAQRRSDCKRLSQLLRGELDWIVMKALEKDRNRRYETASSFAADVQRYLHDEPVQACPPSTWYRLRKFARRNKAGLAVAGLILFFLVLIGGGAGWVARDRAARRDEGERRAEVVMHEAGRLLEQEKWLEALSLVGQAQAVLHNSDGREDLLGQADRLRRDLEMGQSLEEARLKMTAQKDGHFDWQAADGAYAEAFEKYHLDVDGLDPQEAADWVVKSPICRQLTAALDDWASIRKRLKAKGWQHRLALARAADPDRWRNRLRDALEGKDHRALEEVIQSASADNWPPATLALLGSLAQRTALAQQAAALLRRAQQEHPSDFWINQELGLICGSSQPPRLEEAAHYYGIAVALRPQSSGAHLNLGNAMKARGDLDEAIAEFHKALVVDPTYASAHYCVGNALKDQGKLDEAIAEYREAIRIQKDHPEAHCNLGHVLRQKGEFQQAADELRRGHELGSRRPGWPYRSAQWVQEAERLLALDVKLPNVLSGVVQPKDAAETIILAELCGEYKKLPVAAVRFYRDAFAADPELAADLRALHRYNAARAAALAGCGQRKDAGQLDDRKRAGLRGLALDWLRADLTAWDQLLDKGPYEARAPAQQALKDWQQETDFASVRGDGLAKLPEAERQPWQQLWADVQQTLRKADYMEKDLQYKIKRGRRYAETGRFDEAAAHFDKALSLVARSESLIPDPEIIFWSGRAGIDEEVVMRDEVFNALLKLRPNDPQLWAARAYHFSRRSEWPQAARAMAKVNELAPAVRA